MIKLKLTEHTLKTTATECPRESLERAIAFDSKDWGAYKRDAWIYGIIMGWDSDLEDLDDGEESAMDELAAQHRWDSETVARLRRLHEKFKQAFTTTLP